MRSTGPRLGALSAFAPGWAPLVRASRPGAAACLPPRPSFGCRALVTYTGPRLGCRAPVPRPRRWWAPRARGSAAVPRWPPPGPRFGCRAAALHGSRPGSKPRPSFEPLVAATALKLRLLPWCHHRAPVAATAPEARLPVSWRPPPGPRFGCRTLAPLALLRRAADALHRVRASAALVPLVASIGPSFGCRCAGALHRAADALHRTRGSVAAPRCLHRARASAAAPELRLPRPGASTAPLMRSTAPARASAAGLPRCLHRAADALHGPEARTALVAPSNAPGWPPRARGSLRVLSSASELRLPLHWRPPRARGSRRALVASIAPEVRAVAAAPLARQWRRVLALPPRFGRRTWRPPPVPKVRAVAAAVPEVCAASWLLRCA
jgi:hypothetical protein